jgi:hypothetical protein
MGRPEFRAVEGTSDRSHSRCSHLKTTNLKRKIRTERRKTRRDMDRSDLGNAVSRAVAVLAEPYLRSLRTGVKTYIQYYTIHLDTCCLFRREHVLAERYKITVHAARPHHRSFPPLSLKQNSIVRKCIFRITT